MTTLGLVVAEFNEPITEQMEERAREAAADLNVEIAAATHVPGAYDTPLAADRLARRDDIDAVAALGAIITGDTNHDQVIGDAATQGLTRVSLDRDTPVALGIIGPDMTPEEASARVGRGRDAVEAAVQMTEEL